MMLESASASGSGHPQSNPPPPPPPPRNPKPKNPPKPKTPLQEAKTVLRLIICFEELGAILDLRLWLASSFQPPLRLWHSKQHDSRM